MLGIALLIILGAPLMAQAPPFAGWSWANVGPDYSTIAHGVTHHHVHGVAVDAGASNDAYSVGCTFFQDDPFNNGTATVFNADTPNTPTFLPLFAAAAHSQGYWARARSIVGAQFIPASGPNPAKWVACLWTYDIGTSTWGATSLEVSGAKLSYASCTNAYSMQELGVSVEIVAGVSKDPVVGKLDPYVWNVPQSGPVSYVALGRPPGADPARDSVASGVDCGTLLPCVVVGYVTLNHFVYHHACLWQGANWTPMDIHPSTIPGLTDSEAVKVYVGSNGTAGTMIVGLIRFANGHQHAYLWKTDGSGSKSVITGSLHGYDLNPAGATNSEIHSVCGSGCVGSATFNGVTKAVYWPMNNLTQPEVLPCDKIGLSDNWSEWSASSISATGDAVGGEALVISATQGTVPGMQIAVVWHRTLK